MEIMASQSLCLTEFIKILCLVDESTVILNYKSFFVLKEDILFEPEKLDQSFTVVSKYFQGFSSWHLNETMYVSVLIGYGSCPNDFYPSLQHKMESLLHKVYTHSIQAPYICNIYWMFQSYEHTDLPHFTELLEGLLCCLHPDGPPIALGFK